MSDAILAHYLSLLPADVVDRLPGVLADPVWAPRPQNAAQIAACICPADVLLFGGAGGGGKTDLICGLAVTQHKRTLIMRRMATELSGIVSRLRDIIGDKGYNGSSKQFRWQGRDIQLGSMKEPDDWQKQRGVARDLMAFDEAATFMRLQVDNLRAWNRTSDPRQRCRVVMASNPPVDSNQAWLRDMFAAWVDVDHERPAKPGELRYFANLGEAVDVMVDSPHAIMHQGERIIPQSRTYIPATVECNPDMVAAGYMEMLDSLPEPARSMMRYGRWTVQSDDPADQVIPTAWVRAAQARWTPEPPDCEMTALAADIGAGGDRTVISRRYRTWFAPLITMPGNSTPDCTATAGFLIAHQRDAAPIAIDNTGGWGSSVYSHLEGNGVDVYPITFSNKSTTATRQGGLPLANKRAELYWLMRESLDPDYGDNLALPPDRELLTELCAAKWKLSPRGILVEPNEDIQERIGRSPDKADAVVMARETYPKRARIAEAWGRTGVQTMSDYDLLSMA